MSQPTEPSLSDPPLAQTVAVPRAPVSAWLEALEGAWQTLAVQHPDLPPIAFVVDSAPDAFSVRPCGHWTADRWSLPSGERIGELRIPAERLRQGAGAVLELLLHEAAHVLAHVRAVREVSRQGRYHNKHYGVLARELGLTVERDELAGFHQTKLPKRARARYADVLARLEQAWASSLPGSERGETKPEGSASGASLESRKATPSLPPGRLLVLCGCTPARRLRVSRSIFVQGPITCGLCGLPFDITAS
jgi:hypothetical protein